MTDLADRPLTQGQPILSLTEVRQQLDALPHWTLNEQAAVPRIERVYRFADFAQALAFVNQVGALAEAQNHHPALLLEWGKVSASWWSHDAGGVHTNDLTMAARTERLFQQT
ncbi:4a-hydroxytetrahydrobiopterin dehydratase [Halopseudomonas maritima]|uniref:4a-hydroxytetrahydrobiopterin dehydratase n=1 Tax=Halopseudomonas maritima TaxID=2918528 RepID=UPI001EEC3A39|nr:4a-hydroxytetrahydrobiopterin dehydratase [Halopseudomonas maritima]UJJ32120.1 4a-hydroxytetrahydrobiopterin dehydratase [Halopseudomonas maritima]